MSELKPRSFRIDDETLKKFQDIAQNIGGNQQHALNELIETYELYSAKEIISDQSGNIDKYDGYVRSLREMYLNSLTSNQEMEDIVRQKFKRSLDSKDQTIMESQEEINNLRKTIDSESPKRAVLEQRIKDLEQDKQSLINKIKEELEPKIKLLEDENKRINSLSESFEYMKNQLVALEDLQKELEEVTSKSERQKSELEELKKKLIDKDWELKEIEYNLKEQHMNEINTLKADHLAEIAEYQQKFRIVLDQQSEVQKQAEPKNKKTTRKPAVKKTGKETSVDSVNSVDSKEENV